MVLVPADVLDFSDVFWRVATHHVVVQEPQSPSLTQALEWAAEHVGWRGVADGQGPYGAFWQGTGSLVPAAGGPSDAAVETMGILPDPTQLIGWLTVRLKDNGSDPVGDPVVGSTIRLRAQQDGQDLYVAVSDANGEASFQNIAARDYTIKVDPPPSPPAPAFQTEWAGVDHINIVKTVNVDRQ